MNIMTHTANKAVEAERARNLLLAMTANKMALITRIGSITGIKYLKEQLAGSLSLKLGPHELEAIQKLCPLARNYLDSCQTAPVIPTFFTKGDEIAGGNLNRMLRTWPKTTMATEALWRLAPDAVKNMDEAACILDGKKPLAYLGLMDVFSAFKTEGLTADDTLETLLEVRSTPAEAEVLPPLVPHVPQLHGKPVTELFGGQARVVESKRPAVTGSVAPLQAPAVSISSAPKDTQVLTLPNAKPVRTLVMDLPKSLLERRSKAMQDDSFMQVLIFAEHKDKRAAFSRAVKAACTAAGMPIETLGHHLQEQGALFRGRSNSNFFSGASTWRPELLVVILDVLKITARDMLVLVNAEVKAMDTGNVPLPKTLNKIVIAEGDYPARLLAYALEYRVNFRVWYKAKVGNNATAVADAMVAAQATTGVRNRKAYSDFIYNGSWTAARLDVALTFMKIDAERALAELTPPKPVVDVVQEPVQAVQPVPQAMEVAVIPKPVAEQVEVVTAEPSAEPADVTTEAMMATVVGKLITGLSVLPADEQQRRLAKAIAALTGV